MRMRPAPVAIGTPVLEVTMFETAPAKSMTEMLVALDGTLNAIEAKASSAVFFIVLYVW